MKHRRSKRQIKDIIVSLKVTAVLVAAIDEEAERTGLSRSAIIRRALLDAFRDRMPVS